MTYEYQALKNKINAIAIRASSELHKDLYPEKLGERARIRFPEIRLNIISKYEGIASVLNELGADTSNLEKMIDEELKIIEQAWKELIMKETWTIRRYRKGDTYVDAFLGQSKIEVLEADHQVKLK